MDLTTFLLEVLTLVGYFVVIYSVSSVLMAANRFVVKVLVEKRFKQNEWKG